MDDALQRRLDAIHTRLNVVIVLLVLPYLFGLLSLTGGDLGPFVWFAMVGLTLAGFGFLWLVFGSQARSLGR